MFCQILINELGMILIEKKFYSIKMKCQRKIYKCIASALIFGLILQSTALKDILINKVAFFKSTDKFFKK